MRGWWPPWPPWWPPTPPTPTPQPKEPLLLIPGLCGTILHVRPKGNADDKGYRVWVCVANADSTYQKLWGRFNAATGHVEMLDDSIEVVVPTNPSGSEDGGLYSIDILDPDVYLPLNVLYYYRTGINALKSKGYVAGKNLHGMGFDFRQSNRSHSKALLQKLEAMREANGGARINIVSHSMGGLVTKLLLAQYPQAFERLVHKWCAIACPFAGTPAFCQDALLTGAQFTTGWEQYFFVQRHTMRALAVQSPAVFELLPSADHIWPPGHPPPTVGVWLKPDDRPPRLVQYNLTTYRGLLRESLKDYSVLVNGATIPLPMNEALWSFTDESRRLLAAASLPPSCKFYKCALVPALSFGDYTVIMYGGGMATGWSVVYGTEALPLTSTKELLNAPSTFQHVDGDGVVPVASSAADGLFACERIMALAEHRQILNLPSTWEQVVQWLDGAQSAIPQLQVSEAESVHDWVLV